MSALATIWFWLIAWMLTAYVVLDGFDFGAGILHLLVARTDNERRTVLGAIGPVWDGNEVWLVASGGVLVFAFPKVYAAAFSGFYLPLMIVLWVLILRGISIEFRSLQPNPLWRAFWDGTFAFSSTLLAFIFGVALGNLVRGVPLDASGYFHMPLFTDFRASGELGAFDWYTVSVGLFAVAALAGHGATYLAWKTSGEVEALALRWANRLWPLAVALFVWVSLATPFVQPAHFQTLVNRPATWPLAVLAIGALGSVFVALRKKRELAAFLCSSAFLAATLLATSSALFPLLLRSTLHSEHSLSIANSAAGGKGLAYGLGWWIPALILALGYFVYLFHSFRGKVVVGKDGHGY